MTLKRIQIYHHVTTKTSSAHTNHLLSSEHNIHFLLIISCCQQIKKLTIMLCKFTVTFIGSDS